MKHSSNSRPYILKFIAKGCVILFLVPVLGTWLAGSAICAVIAPIAGVLRTLGVDGIGMRLSPSYSLPVLFSIPFGLGLALVLSLSFYYTRRLLRICLQFIHS